ncbi:MAG: META domain-containing protein [Anaerolineae bacterium]
MSNLRDLVLFGLLASILASCGRQAMPTPVPGQISVADIFEISWQWADWAETEAAGQSLVPEPENYTLLFMPGGPLFVQADCNTASGSYRLEGNELTLGLEETTNASCLPESLSGQFLELLGQVDTAAMDRGRLVLHLREDGGQMTFDYGGPAGAPRPEPTPVASATPGSPAIALDTMGLPYAWQANLVPPSPYDESPPPGPTGLPEHVQINFGAGSADRAPGDPVIYIIPVQDYLQQWEAAEDPAVSLALEHLQAILTDRPSPVPPFGMPVLPFEEVTGVNDLAVQGEFLDLPAASGVRFVGRFAQDANPVSNSGLRYIFQGFTPDGEHLVTFFYPVTTSALPSPEEVSSEEQERAASDSMAYLDDTVQMLNALGEGQWDPNLSTLDLVLGSLTIGTVDAGR